MNIYILVRRLVFLVGVVPMLCFTAPTLLNKPSVLLSLSADSGAIEMLQSPKHRYQLIVNEVMPNISYFTDRPLRVVGQWSLTDLSNIWHQGNDTFKTTPPNAILFYRDGQSGEKCESVIELLSQKVDVKNRTISYQFTFLTAPKVPASRISDVHLVIDNWTPHGW